MKAGVGIGSVYYFPTGYFIASGTGEDRSKVFERNPVELGDTSGSIVRDGKSLNLGTVVSILKINIVISVS